MLSDEFYNNKQPDVGTNAGEFSLILNPSILYDNELTRPRFMHVGMIVVAVDGYNQIEHPTWKNS